MSLDPIILFFALGALASWVRSDFEFPEAISKFLSIYLLLSIGLKGGHEVRTAEDLSGLASVLFLGLASCALIPSILFLVLKNRLKTANAAAMAAAYGSVSAVTFMTAQNVLQMQGWTVNGYMVAVMALMEIPAITISLFLYYSLRSDQDSKTESRSVPILRSILTAKSVVLLLGGFGIGLTMSEVTWAGISLVVQDSFKGVLAFFLLDLGIAAQRQLREVRKDLWLPLVLAVVFPLTMGMIFLVLGHAVGLPASDVILLAVLVGSASYIAAPAAMRASIPSANPSLYLALPLAVTFPLNLLFGIPLYIEVTQWILGVKSGPF